MPTPYTEIIVLLDRSASMGTIKKAMESGFNEFTEAHKKTPSTRLTLVEFDSPVGWNMDAIDLQVRYTAMPITEVPKLDLVPRGNTPLLDALCMTIDMTGRRLKNMDADLRPASVLFVIITDGEENRSKQYKRADVLQRVTHQTEKYEWQFVYLGANQDALLEAHSYGIPMNRAITYNHTGGGTHSAMNAMLSNSANYVTRVASGETQCGGALDYSAQQRAEAAEQQSDTLADLNKALIPTP